MLAGASVGRKAKLRGSSLTFVEESRGFTLENFDFEPVRGLQCRCFIFVCPTSSLSEQRSKSTKI
jgi:hypothetical protein